MVMIGNETPCDIGCHVLCASTDCACDCDDHAGELE